MVSRVNSHTNASSKRRHLWEIDLRFDLNSTPGWLDVGGDPGEEERDVGGAARLREEGVLRPDMHS